MEQDLKKVLVTGANGFIGKQVAKYLAHKSYRVIAIDRHKTWEDRNIEFIKSDLFDIDNLALNKEAFDTVVHLAAFLGMHEKGGKLFLGNFKLTEKLLNFFKDTKAYFIYFSSVEVSGPTEKKEVNESDVPRPITDYGKVKLKTENLIKKSNLRYSILRIGNAIDDERGPLYDIKKTVQEKTLYDKIQSFIIKNIIFEYELNLIHVRDICRVIEKLINTKATNQLYFCTNQAVSLEQISKNEQKKSFNFKFLLPLLLFFCKLCIIFKISHLICYITEGNFKRKWRRYSNKKIIEDLKMRFGNIL